MLNCLLAGVGGQGTVLASKLLAQAAIKQGLQARTAETIGMAQRGGCVVSHVRIGRESYSPLITAGQADVLIGFEPAEAVRCLYYLKKGGTVIVSNHAIKPITDTFAKVPYDEKVMLDYLKKQVENLVVVDTEEVCTKAGSSKVVNIALLGAASASGCVSISKEELLQIISEQIPEKYQKMNKTALLEGAKYAED